MQSEILRRLPHRTDLHLSRKVWHAGMGLLIVGIYALTPITRFQGVMLLAAFLGFIVTMEYLRLNNPKINELTVKLWKPLMRSCEVNKVSGIPYYVGAALLGVAIFPKPVAILSLLYLAFGDPTASLFGVLFGDRSIRFAHGKSLIGCLSAVLVCGVVTILYGSTLNLNPSSLAILTVVGAFVGGFSELLPLEIDDNFSIPLVSGIALWLVLILLSLN